MINHCGGGCCCGGFGGVDNNVIIVFIVLSLSIVAQDLINFGRVMRASTLSVHQQRFIVCPTLKPCFMQLRAHLGI